MNFFYRYARAHNEALRILFQKKIMRNYSRYCLQKKGHALLYYKNDCLIPGYIHTYTHTNNWEITEMVKILNELGYWVDIIDRGITEPPSIPDTYDIFIGCGNSDSSKWFPVLAKQVPHATKIFYTTTAEPTEHNHRIEDRYSAFAKRTGKSLSPRRMNTSVSMPESMKVADTIFSLANQYNNEGYRKYGKKIYEIASSTSPHLRFSPQEKQLKKPNNFLFLGGTGNIVKGLDLAFEAFSALPHLELHVASPLESDFLHYYHNLLERSKNIYIHGFMPVQSKKFMAITNECSFVILPSATEGTATSVTTSMRRGLIPIITRETGVDVKNFGFLLADSTVLTLQKTVHTASQLSQSDLYERMEKTYQASKQYTQASFRQSFTKALLETLSETAE